MGKNVWFQNFQKWRIHTLAFFTRVDFLRVRIHVQYKCVRTTVSHSVSHPVSHPVSLVRFLRIKIVKVSVKISADTVGHSVQSAREFISSMTIMVRELSD